MTAPGYEAVAEFVRDGAKAAAVPAAAPAVPPLPTSPEQAASRLLGLLLAVSRARHQQTTTYCRAFLDAEGAQEHRRAIAAQSAAAAQQKLDDATAELEAFRLLIDLSREEHT